jgi:hypothetical protein
VLYKSAIEVEKVAGGARLELDWAVSIEDGLELL